MPYKPRPHNTPGLTSSMSPWPYLFLNCHFLFETVRKKLSLYLFPESPSPQISLRRSSHSPGPLSPRLHLTTSLVTQPSLDRALCHRDSISPLPFSLSPLSPGPRSPRLHLTTSLVTQPSLDPAGATRTWCSRSAFSTDSFFLAVSKSPNVRLASSSLPLSWLSCSWRPLVCFSSAA